MGGLFFPLSHCAYVSTKLCPGPFLLLLNLHHKPSMKTILVFLNRTMKGAGPLGGLIMGITLHYLWSKGQPAWGSLGPTRKAHLDCEARKLVQDLMYRYMF